MQRRGYISVLTRLLKECYSRPHHQCCSYIRNYATVPDSQKTPQKIEEVAILGGGITGLATAFYISNAFSDVHVTLYEGGSRLGGWLRSSSVDVGNGRVVFEQGPRTLRPNPPNGLVTLDLVCHL